MKSSNPYEVQSKPTEKNEWHWARWPLLLIPPTAVSVLTWGGQSLGFDRIVVAIGALITGGLGASFVTMYLASGEESLEKVLFFLQLLIVMAAYVLSVRT